MQLDTRQRYTRAIQHLVQRGALGYSSEAKSECVEEGTNGLIICWPIVNATLTPTPLEFRQFKMRQRIPRTKLLGADKALQDWIDAQLGIHQEYLEAVGEMYDADNQVQRAKAHHARTVKMFGRDVYSQDSIEANQAVRAAEFKAQWTRFKYGVMFRLGIAGGYQEWQRTKSR
jgi:hypothetical protein